MLPALTAPRPGPQNILNPSSWNTLNLTLADHNGSQRSTSRSALKINQRPSEWWGLGPDYRTRISALPRSAACYLGRPTDQTVPSVGAAVDHCGSRCRSCSPLLPPGCRRSCGRAELHKWAKAAVADVGSDMNAHHRLPALARQRHQRPSCPAGFSGGEDVSKEAGPTAQ